MVALWVFQPITAASSLMEGRLFAKSTIPPAQLLEESRRMRKETQISWLPAAEESMAVVKSVRG